MLVDYDVDVHIWIHSNFHKCCRWCMICYSNYRTSFPMFEKMINENPTYCPILFRLTLSVYFCFYRSRMLAKLCENSQPHVTCISSHNRDSYVFAFSLLWNGKGNHLSRSWRHAWWRHNYVKILSISNNNIDPVFLECSGPVHVQRNNSSVYKHNSKSLVSIYDFENNPGNTNQ